MTVYVESNFVLEEALQQEQSESCVQLIALARERRIQLVVPAFSLAEPHETIARKGHERSRLSNDLRIQLNDLGRSKSHQEVPATFTVLADVLTESAQVALAGLRRTVSELLSTAEVISLDAGVLTAAAELALTHDLSGPDSIVLASVLSHLKRDAPQDSCFLNRNSRDFDNPSVLDSLADFGCKYFARFDHGLSYVNSNMG